MKKYFGLASALFLFSLLGGCGHRHNQTVDAAHEVKINFSVGSAKSLGLTNFIPGAPLSVSDYEVIITCYGVTPDGTAYQVGGVGISSIFSPSRDPAFPAPLIPVSLSQCTSSLQSVRITDGVNSQFWNSRVSGNFPSDPDYFVAFGNSIAGSQINFRLSSPSPMGGSASNPWSLTYEFAFTQPVQTAIPSVVDAGSANHTISIVSAIEPLPSIASLANLGVSLDATNGISILNLDDSGSNNLFAGSTTPCGSDTFFVYADTPNSSGFAPPQPVTPYLASNAATQTSRAVTSSAGINSILIPNTASVASSILSNCANGSYHAFAAVGCANTSGLASYYWVDIQFDLIGSSAPNFYGSGTCPI